MAVDTCLIDKTESNENSNSCPLLHVEQAKITSQKNSQDVDVYTKYSLTNQKIISIKSNEKRVALAKLEWLVLREGCKDTEYKWFILTLSLCVSLSFSTACLIGTATFQQDEEILWLPLLTALLHITGCVVFGILSAYFCQKIRRAKRDSVYQSLKRDLDNEFSVTSDKVKLFD